MFDIRVDDRELKSLERNIKHLGGSMGTVMSRAINKTETTARARIARLLSDRTGVSVTNIKKGMRIDKASPYRWAASIRIQKKPLPLATVNPSKRSKGASFKTRRGRVLVRHAFQALGGWAVRADQSEPNRYWVSPAEASGVETESLVPRMPIARIKGPFISALYRSMPEQHEKIFKEAQAILEKNITNQVQLILNRKGAA